MTTVGVVVIVCVRESAGLGVPESEVDLQPETLYEASEERVPDAQPDTDAVPHVDALPLGL